MSKRLLLLLCMVVVGYVLMGIVAFLMIQAFGSGSTKGLRIVIILQDLLVFIMPAIATAIIITSRPADLLVVNARIPVWPLVMGICTLIVSIPAMNAVVWLNESIQLPEALDTVLREMENSAGDTVKAVIGPHTVPNFIMALLIVAVFAGLSEELLFRGAFQRIMVTGGVNHHVAIWVVAFVFGVVHLQFYGIIPRMLLGAFFGYLLWWTRCLWIPVILHALNNTFYLVGNWFSEGNGDGDIIGEIGYGQNWFLVVVSAVLVVLGLIMIRRSCPKSDPC